MKSSNKLKMLLVKPKCEPEVIEVDNKIEALQSLVGGYLETITMLVPIYHIIVCNEEGKFKSLPPNRYIGCDVIVGNFFITTSREGDFASLSEEDIEVLMELYSLKSTVFTAAI